MLGLLVLFWGVFLEGFVSPPVIYSNPQFSRSAAVRPSVDPLGIFSLAFFSTFVGHSHMQLNFYSYDLIVLIILMAFLECIFQMEIYSFIPKAFLRILNVDKFRSKVLTLQ